MAKLTWLGDGDPEAESITVFGYVFAKGEPVDVTDKKTAEKLAINPLFSTHSDEDDAEIAELRKLLDDAGIEYSPRAKAPALRAKLDDATK